jgi:AmmeMemoRadiSam system protein B
MPAFARTATVTTVWCWSDPATSALFAAWPAAAPWHSAHRSVTSRLIPTHWTELQVNDAAHQDEHSLEVQLPFLQVTLEAFCIVPLLVGEARDRDVAEVIDALWVGADTLVVVSSDLSHYLPYRAARSRDALTCRAVEQLDGPRIGHGDACGAAPLRGLLRVARQRGLRAETLDLRNSGDTAGNHDRVVGYGAWSIVEELPCQNAA